MSEAQRKTYTPAFKAKVGLEAIRGVKTVNEIGQDHGVHPAQVGQGQREIQEQAQTLSSGTPTSFGGMRIARRGPAHDTLTFRNLRAGRIHNPLVFTPTQDP
ncbi:MAG: hypothetical protein IT487_14740 [Chromatiaceae bacterium]|nr:hypothetical protein [Chromatiaceae bacterium]